MWTPDDEHPLYHYTCSHGYEALGDGLCTLLPMAQQRECDPRLWPALFVWATDLRTPNREGLGLTSRTLRCDRTTHRYRVTEGPDIERWVDSARHLTREVRDQLEAEPGAMPMHWWFSSQAITAVYDPRV